MVDINSKSGRLTAENLWDLIVVYFPIILRKRVSSMRYQQILKLRKIWIACTSQSFTLEEVNELEILIVEFVKIQENYVYKRDFNRLPACTSQVHLLLHLPHQIKATGPHVRTGHF